MKNPFFVAGRSDIGRVRRRNEDCLAIDPPRGVAVVADGMGGHPGGDVASRIAATTAAEYLAAAVELGRGKAGFVERLTPAMSDAVSVAHTRIRAHGDDEPELRGMGTTLTALVIAEDGAWVIGHVGDSRAYRLRDGRLSQLTRDDTWIQQRVDQGDVLPENARTSPYAHLLTQCLGLEESPDPQVISGIAAPGDVYLLCSDGLVGMLDDHEIVPILADVGRDPASADAGLTQLIVAANDAGGHDNITAALVSFGPG